MSCVRRTRVALVALLLLLVSNLPLCPCATCGPNTLTPDAHSCCPPPEGLRARGAARCCLSVADLPQATQPHAPLACAPAPALMPRVFTLAGPARQWPSAACIAVLHPSPPPLSLRV